MREFMDEEEIEQQDVAALPHVCRYIRTKTAFGNSVGYQPWQLGNSSTAAYWCLQTMASVGPDEQLVEPRACCAGRECFHTRDAV
jgi:hypothetical protein